MSRLIYRLFLIVCSLQGIISLSTGLSFNSNLFGRAKYPFTSRFVANGRYPTNNGIYPGYYPGGNGPFSQQHGCPICDSSVYGYCTHKLIHDSCCCGDAYLTENSFECQYTDCNYLHANTCQESELIATCCCEDAYRSYNPHRFFNKK